MRLARTAPLLGVCGALLALLGTACGNATIGPAVRADAPESAGPQDGSASDSAGDSAGDPAGGVAAEPTGDDTTVGCFGRPSGWLASAMPGGIETAERDALAAAVPSYIRADPAWFVLAQSDTDATVAAGTWDADGPGEDARVATLTRGDDGWRTLSWGECGVLAPVPDPGRQRVEVRAARDLDPTSTTLSLRLREASCTGARDPRPHLGTPEVVETDESVTIRWTSAAIDGAATCQANTWVPGTVELAAPLGDRVLLDASRWPAHPIGNGG